MPAKKKPTGTDADPNSLSMLLLFVDEDKAREFLEAKRWKNGRICPRCRCEKTYPLTPKPESKSPVRPGVYKCSGCRKQFTVRIGTIFEESRLPLRKWLMAIHLMTASKKGVSSHQIARQLDITQKTAWFLCHRIREAMKKEPMTGMLKGDVEVDEAYIGPRKTRHKETSKRGRGTSKKPMMVLVELDGSAYSMPIKRPDKLTVQGAIHQLSRRHLHRYLHQFSFRWDHRKIFDGERMVEAIEGAEGTQLRYA